MNTPTIAEFAATRGSPYWQLHALIPRVLADHPAAHVVRYTNDRQTALAILGPHDARGLVIAEWLLADRSGRLVARKRHRASASESVRKAVRFGFSTIFESLPVDEARA